jgi:hypothetical protein
MYSGYACGNNVIINKLNGVISCFSLLTLNVQLCACEALPPLPPTDVVVEPVSTSELSVTWLAPDDMNSRVFTGFVIICDNVEDSYVPRNGNALKYSEPVDKLTMSGAEYVIQIITIGPLHNSSAVTVRQRTSKWQ